MPKETFGNFIKQTIWVEEVSGQWPNTFSIDMSGKVLEFMQNFNKGDIVDVECNLRGRHWEKGDNEGVFNSISGWKISRRILDSASQQPANDGHPSGFEPLDVNPVDDLPF